MVCEILMFMFPFGASCRPGLYHDRARNDRPAKDFADPDDESQSPREIGCLPESREQLFQTGAWVLGLSKIFD